MFVTTKHSFCCDKIMQVSFLSQQTHACCDKYLSQQKFCCDKHIFVTPRKRFLRQTYFCHTKEVFCHDKLMFVAKKTVVATKMILVAALASDRDQVLEVFIIISNVIFRLR